MLAEFLAVLLSPVPAVAYSRPLPGAVVQAFEAPPDPYAAGHRGVDLASSTGEAVRTAAAGEVSFSGVLAGRGVVVITHPDGIRTEYEPVAPLVTEHELVTAGEVIGVVDGVHGKCEPGGCLHWGARRADGTYLDPLTLLPALGPVRLMPWEDG
ncbi:MAG TPA: M23 family metallopeptidase [Jatrophihabitans sp.]|jgi:murein DD-endopeptidase MepM/ murein hydrolase activator NlpD